VWRTLFSLFFPLPLFLLFCSFLGLDFVRIQESFFEFFGKILFSSLLVFLLKRARMKMKKRIKGAEVEIGGNVEVLQLGSLVGLVVRFA
jgi:hypothetical protein